MVFSLLKPLVLQFSFFEILYLKYVQAFLPEALKSATKLCTLTAFPLKYFQAKYTALFTKTLNCYCEAEKLYRYANIYLYMDRYCICSEVTEESSIVCLEKEIHRLAL